MFTLTRCAMSDKGVFGVLSKDGIPLCVTCEDPWNDNKTGISCIPAGSYKVVPHHSAKYPDVWRLEDVPGRLGILIHSGNTIKDTQGCILVGESFSGASIINSRIALSKLRNILPGTFELTIVQPKE